MARGLRPFRAWDGEGAEPEVKGQPQRYVILCANDFPHLYSPHGIPTIDALWWLVEHQHHTPGIQIAYGSSYDVNMILADLPVGDVAALYLETDWTVELADGEWRLQWIPGKMFNVQAPDGRWARTWDTFGFFQCSFVGALQRWGIPTPDYLLEMKEKRGTFQVGGEYELKAYSELECGLLVQLMGQVRDGLRQHDVKPRTWHGAGAIASACLREAGVKNHLGRDSRTPHVEETILRAYFGGRTELFVQGELASAVQYDVNSAYAAALRQLPDGRGTWRRCRSWQHEGRWAPWGLWHIDWDLNDLEEILSPLPYRAGRGIFYPICGEGWYHASEVRAALREYPDKVRVGTGYVFEPATGAKPFAFVEELYALRQQLAAAQDPAATALKFGLASVWGKLSQATSRNGRVPTYQDYFWAGATTALVRGWMLEIAAAHRHRLVQISTDGLVLAGHDGSYLDKKCGPGLGQLRRSRLQEVLIAQPGMMAAWDADTGEEINHTRGFFRREIDFEKLRAVWRSQGPHGTLHTQGVRFVGIGTCMANGTYKDWRKWKNHRQELSLHSSRKYYSALNGLKPAYQLLPPFQVREGLSSIYEPKHHTWEQLEENMEWVQGTEQPLMAF